MSRPPAAFVSRLLYVGLALVVITCAPSEVPGATGPADAVTIENATGGPVTILYESPGGATERLAQLAAGERVVDDTLFEGREGLCRTGRLVALTQDSTEIDELYNVCLGRVWTVEGTPGP